MVNEKRNSTARFKKFSKRALAISIGSMLLSCSWLSAQEGNYKFENFGNQSVLLSGNVTGSVSDLGLVFHNPARLGLIENPSFTIGGKAYEWSKYYFDDVLQTEKNLSANRFGGIPATIAGTFDLKFLPGHKFAYSILSRYRTDVQLNYNSGLIPDEEFPEVPDAEESFTDLYFRDRLRDDWFGITWSYPISETFSVGASLFGSIYEHNGNGDILINVQRESMDVITYTQRLDYTQKTYGGQIKLGAAWILKNLDMGVNVSLPLIAVKNRASFRYQESLSGFSESQDFVLAADYGDLQSSRRTAASISYGVGIPWKKHKLHLAVDWHAPIGSYERIELPQEILENLDENPFKEQLRAVFNFGGGGEFYISPSLNVIASFSSDFSATVESINLFDIINQSTEDINLLNDLWHIALGVDLTRPWGSIIVGASYASTSSKVPSAPVIPSDSPEPQPRSVTTQISYERWRFIVGLEIPLLLEKVKDIPIPIR